MKVLVIAHEPNFCGGANRSLFSNLCELKKKHDIEFLVLTPSKKGLLNKKLEEIGIPWISVKYFGVISGIRDDKKDILRYLKVKLGFYLEKIQAIRVCRKIKNRKIDLVYTNTRLPIIGANIAEKLKIPHVIHVRELGAEKPLWGKWGFKEIEKKSEKIILISNALKKQFVNNGVDEKKIVVSHNGIEYKPVEFLKKKLSNEVHLAIVGRIVPDKGQEEAILAINKIIKNDLLIDKKIFLHIVGSSPKRMHIKWYEEKLKKMVNDLGINENVIFEGEINNIREFRRDMDIELVCSINETFGRVTVEAMRNGVLVIGSNTGGTVELIEDRVNGYLYNQGDYEDLAQKIINSLENEEKYNKLRENAFNSTLDNYTVEKNCTDIYNVLRDTYEKGIN